MTLDIAYTRIARCHDRSVRKPRHHAGAVSKAAVRGIVLPFLSPGSILHQPVAIGADPQMIISIHIHAADTLAVKLLCEFILYLSAAGSIHHIKSLVSTDIVAVLP